MSAISSPSQPVSSRGGATLPAVASADVDASCRGPLLLLFLSAAGWLLAASVLGLLASLKFHSPALLAECPVLTYGRVRPGATNALVYGFALQAGLGVLLWLMARLGRVRLSVQPLVVAGGLFWNLGVTLGVLGILGGDSSGYEWLELPRYAAVLLFFGYLAIGVAGLVTFHQRTERSLYLSQWFLLAALFWFPWIYSAANLLLQVAPVRGVMQAVVDGWYATNLLNIWFGFVGLAAIFYFVPKLADRPLHSHYLGLFTFWMLLFFGSWGGGLPAGAPTPSWLPALSSFATWLTLVPVLAVAVNVGKTLCGQSAKVRGNASLRFIAFGAAAFVVAGLLTVLALIDKVSEITNFTWFNPALAQLAVYGFFVMTMFGAIYYIVPKVLGRAFGSDKLIVLHFWLAALGILIYALPLLAGGVKQGQALNHATTPFLETMKGTLPFLRASTLGDLLMLLGHLVFLLNLVGLLRRHGQEQWTAFMDANKRAGEARA